MADSKVDVVVAVVQHEDTGRLLALRKAESYRDRKERYQHNPWEFPGGKIEDGETAEEAAVRELQEETGIEGKAISQGSPYSREHGSTSYRFHPVLVTTEQQKATLSDEHDRSRWIGPDQVGDHATTTEERAVERFQD